MSNWFSFILDLFKSSSTGTKGMQKLIPLYVDYDSPLWKDLLKLAPETVIINPADGPGDKNWGGRKQWITLINSLRAKNWKVVYYIDCQNAVFTNNKWELSRKKESILLEEKALYDLYPKADGYFLDDYPQKDLYPEIISLEKTLTGKIFANPGLVPSNTVLDASRANVIVAHETNGFPKSKPNISKEVAAIVFGGTDDKILKDQKWNYGVVYKNKESANPFESLPV